MLIVFQMQISQDDLQIQFRFIRVGDRSYVIKTHLQVLGLEIQSIC